MARAAKPKSDLAYLCRALKAPSLAASIDRLAERARADGWGHEEFLAACLEREVAARQDHGGEARIRAARFPARKMLEDFDFSFQRSLKREVITHLGTLDFVEAKDNVVFLGPPGRGRPTWPSAWASGPARPATQSPSPPPWSGWLDWERPMARDACRPSCAAWGASRSW